MTRDIFGIDHDLADQSEREFAEILPHLRENVMAKYEKPAEPLTIERCWRVFEKFIRDANPNAPEAAMKNTEIVFRNGAVSMVVALVPLFAAAQAGNRQAVNNIRLLDAEAADWQETQRRLEAEGQAKS